MAKTVLICDDEQYILEAVSFVVRGEGYQVITAEDGEEGVRLAREHKPELLLLDVMMPGKNGFDVCRELKNDPATQGMHVIMLTAMGQERDMDEGYRCGANDYIMKPFGPRALRKKLHEVLD
jgi:DNA-binding response OmpR family regulator